MELGGEIFSESTAALGIAQRQGIGKLRHVRTQALWVQEARAEGRLQYKKVLGSRNPADALTKYMPGVLMDQHITTVGLKFQDGRAESAPELNNLEAHTEVSKGKAVEFNAFVGYWWIPARGKMKPVTRATRTIWRSTAGTASVDFG